MVQAQLLKSCIETTVRSRRCWSNTNKVLTPAHSFCRTIQLFTNHYRLQRRMMAWWHSLFTSGECHLTITLSFCLCPVFSQKGRLPVHCCPVSCECLEQDIVKWIFDVISWFHQLDGVDLPFFQSYGHRKTPSGLQGTTNLFHKANIPFHHEVMRFPN